MTISVLGLGNVLMSDDGLGPVAVRAFEAEYVVPADMQVVDLGTPGLDLLPWLADVGRVIIVDTVKSDRPPGTVRLYDKADLLRYPPSARVGPHDPGLKEALRALELAGRAPREVTLIGVVPASTAIGLELTPPVRSAVATVLVAIEVTLARFGRPVAQRTRQRRMPPASIFDLPLADAAIDQLDRPSGAHPRT
ncbi:MAG TPA: HyaD/HybD family hydrogenase maturation endopeptidase [Vicinamibacterales bacterium]|nr:HyaD/HybD family hydrogenase maturation endopeptidase [Vicinamibacterales bacterium]